MGLDLRTSMAQCASMRVTAPSAGYESGDLIRVEDTTLVVVADIAAAATGAAIYKAEKILLPKSTTSGQNILAAGDKVYLDAAEAKICSGGTGNTLCGRCLEAAGASATTVLVDFDGTLA